MTGALVVSITAIVAILVVVAVVATVGMCALAYLFRGQSEEGRR